MWLQWNELKELCKYKKIVFFGRGEWVEKTLPYGKFNAKFIVDNNKNEQGTVEHNLNIYSPEKLKELKNEINDYLVVITTTDFYNVSEQLERYGLVSGRHFCVTPALINNKILNEIRSYSKKIILSSSDPIDETSLHKGGGIYIYDTTSLEYKKIISVITQGFGRLDDKYYIIDDNAGLRIFDLELTNEIDRIKLPKKSRPHGMTIQEETGYIFIAFSSMDAIGVYDTKKNELVKMIEISNKFKRTNTASHHLNDLCVTGESLYISMFSQTGNWKKGIFDGVIMEYDLHSNQILGPMVQNLWTPHSIKMIDGMLCYLDSMRGNFHITTHKVAASFNGFIRGLDFDGKFYVIGQSVHRYFDRMKEFSNNIALDCGFFVFDNESKGCKFYAMPSLLDIHTLEIIDDWP